MAATAGPGGAPGSTGDTHYKMCKKIALLTKVIYHLNIKNEDHDDEVSRLRARHDDEIARISADAADKIAKFADAAANNKEVARLEGVVAAMKEAQQKERDDAKALVAEAEKRYKCV